MQTRLQQLLAHARAWMPKRNGALLPIIFAETTPLDLRIVGRMLFHTALVGVAAGFAGALFFAALEYAQLVILEGMAGYRVLRARGESFASGPVTETFRPWLLLCLPALGGLACGILARFVPEVRGGGGDAMIEAFHHRGGIIRRRVIWAKAAASLFTLGTGGAGGREGPTMHIGGALGSLVGRVLKVSSRERRILLVAGVAAGIAAVFRTPLGAALLAVEILYRDGYEILAAFPSSLSISPSMGYSPSWSRLSPQSSSLFCEGPRKPLTDSRFPIGLAPWWVGWHWAR